MSILFGRKRLLAALASAGVIWATSGASVEATPPLAQSWNVTTPQSGDSEDPISTYSMQAPQPEYVPNNPQTPERPPLPQPPTPLTPTQYPPGLQYPYQPPQTGTPGKPGTPGTPGKPGTGKPGTGKPGTGTPGTGTPGTGKPGSGKPGTGTPGTGIPGGGFSQLPPGVQWTWGNGKPDSTIPGSSGSSIPGSPTPDFNIGSPTPPTPDQEDCPQVTGWSGEVVVDGQSHAVSFVKKPEGYWLYYFDGAPVTTLQQVHDNGSMIILYNSSDRSSVILTRDGAQINVSGSQLSAKGQIELVG